MLPQMQHAERETGIQMQWYCWKTTGEENWHVNYGWDRGGETRAKEGWRRRNPRHQQHHHTWFISNQSAVLFWCPPIRWKRCCCHYSFVLSAKHEVGNLRARPPNRTGSLNPSPPMRAKGRGQFIFCVVSVSAPFLRLSTAQMWKEGAAFRYVPSVKKRWVFFESQSGRWFNAQRGIGPTWPLEKKPSQKPRQ